MNIIHKQIRYSMHNIAKAISLAFSNGDKEKASKYYEEITKSLSHTKIHVSNDQSPFKLDRPNPYLYKLIELAKPLDKKYNTTIEKNLHLMAEGHFNRNSSTNINDYAFHNLFLRYKALFDNCLVNEEQAYSIYKQNKDLFNLFVKQLDDFWEQLAQMKTQISKDKEHIKTLDSILNNLSLKYYLYSHQDFLDFYHELNALITDTTSLDENTLKIVNEYRNKAKQRGKLVELSSNEINGMIKSIKSIMTNPTFKNLLENPHIKAYCNDIKVPLSLQSLSTIATSLSELHKEDRNGATLFDNYGVVCIFKTSIKDISAKVQNNIITHELIHAYTLTNSTLEEIKLVHENYHNIDELLTEYLSRQTINYLDDNILNLTRNREIMSSLGYPQYEPIMKELQHTPLMDTLIDIKVNNDYQNIEARVGKDTLSLLNDYLSNPYDKNKFYKLVSKIANIR